MEGELLGFYPYYGCGFLGPTRCARPVYRRLPDGSYRLRLRLLDGAGWPGRPGEPVRVVLKLWYALAGGAVLETYTRTVEYEPCHAWGGCEMEWTVRSRTRRPLRLLAPRRRRRLLAPIRHGIYYRYDPEQGEYVPAGEAGSLPRTYGLVLARWPLRVHRVRGYASKCFARLEVPARLGRPIAGVRDIYLDTGHAASWITTDVRRRSMGGSHLALFEVPCRFAPLAPGEARVVEAERIIVHALRPAKK